MTGTAFAQTKIVVGDMNNDGKLTIEDVTLLTDNILNERTPSYTITGTMKYSDGNEHEYVDLGLPSKTLWATCNVGAKKPEAAGNYYAWGETKPQSPATYDWTSYSLCEGTARTLKKYCFHTLYGLDGYTDALTALEATDDAAASNWSDDWVMPTYEQVDELINPANTKCKWTQQNGVDGYLITSLKNSNSIFLPAAGYYNNGNFTTGVGRYWLKELSPSQSTSGRDMEFSSTTAIKNNTSVRYRGFNVRPVQVGRRNVISVGDKDYEINEAEYVADSSTKLYVELSISEESGVIIVINNYSGSKEYDLTKVDDFYIKWGAPTWEEVFFVDPYSIEDFNIERLSVNDLGDGNFEIILKFTDKETGKVYSLNYKGKMKYTEPEG